MFSPTIIASSTTIPSTTTKANNDMTLIETSRPGIIASAPRNEIGIPRLTHTASRSSKNKARTRKTRRNPVAPFRSISERRAFSNLAESCHTVSATPAGTWLCAMATYSYTRSAISIALWLPVRNTDTRMVGCTSKRPYWSVSANPSTTVATSPNWSRLPSGRVQRTIFSYSSPR